MDLVLLSRDSTMGKIYPPRPPVGVDLLDRCQATCKQTRPQSLSLAQHDQPGALSLDVARNLRDFARASRPAPRVALLMLLLLPHAPDALLVRSLPPRLLIMRSRHPAMCSDREEEPTEQRGPLERFTAFADASWDRSRHPAMCSDREEEPIEQRGPLERFTAFADASWDLFVMPGEYANSRYDRVIPPMNASEPEPGPDPGRGAQRSAFNWGGDSEEEEALRLPKGIPAAERLAAERGPLPKKRGVSQAWLAVPSLIWLLSFGSFIVSQQPSDPAVSDPSRTPGMTESRPERRLTQAEWMRENIAQREADAAMTTSQP